MFALVDANSFYCSAEQVFRPDWRGRPIVVLSNNDGCIIAANRQAKAAGIQKFGPYFKQRAFCEQRGVIALSSNYELYADLSAKMMATLDRFAPEQHVYSIDESFLSFERTPCIEDLEAHGHLIRRTIWRECRLPVCVGFGPTVTLAKAANHAAKKLEGYHGVCLIDTEQKRKDVLSKMPVRDVWGVGSRLSKHLNEMKINTALQLSQMNPSLASKRFSVEVERSVRELAGERCKHWETGTMGKRQIFSTRSVGQRITDFHELQQALCKHAGIIATKLRQQGSRCAHLMIFAHNSPFDDNPVSFRHFHRLEVPSSDTLVLAGIVSQASHKLFRQGVQYYKIGVGAVDLAEDKFFQMDLLSVDASKPQLMQTLDAVNERYGRDTLFVARQGGEQKWSMKRSRLTPKYTTSWRDLPKINC